MSLETILLGGVVVWVLCAAAIPVLLWRIPADYPTCDYEDDVPVSTR